MSSRWRSSSASETGRARAALPVALFFAFAAAVAGCSAVDALMHPGGAGAAAGKPAAPARIAFDHKFHLSRGVTCVDCHENAGKDAKVAMPKVEVCTDCHEEIDAKKPKEKTIAAFRDGPNGPPQWSHVTPQADTITFSHATHAAKKIDCAECHVGIAESTAVSKSLFVDMDACTKCHAAKAAKTDCATCHKNAGEGLKPESHRHMWSTMHGQVVRRGAPQSREENCALCHSDQTCRTCHMTEQPRDHSQFWREGGGHGLSAAMDRARCDACHTPDACVQCHTTLPPRSHRGGWGAPRDTHCVTCHLPLTQNEQGGCGVCHKGTPSHDAAPQMPANPPHRPDLQCTLCHTQKRLKHAWNGTNCLVCHK